MSKYIMELEEDKINTEYLDNLLKQGKINQNYYNDIINNKKVRWLVAFTSLVGYGRN